MIVQDLINKKDYDYISWRVTSPPYWDEPDIFAGACKSKDGELIPLDGDSYSENEIVLKYEEWTTDNLKNCLTVVIKTEWM